MVLDGATDVFLWFLISNMDDLKAFKPKDHGNPNKWVYADTALQVLASLKPDQTVLAQRAATALGAVNVQKNGSNPEPEAVDMTGARLG